MIRIKTVPLAIFAIAGILGGVAITQLAGYWRTTSTKEPVKFQTGELAGLPNPADIRGSYTWQDLEKAFGVPAVESAAAFSTAAHVFEVSGRVSELEEIYAGVLPEGFEIGTGAVRLFVALYTGLPYEDDEGSVLPEAALKILASRPGMDADALKAYALPGTAGAAPAVPSETAATTTAAAKPAASTEANPSPAASTTTTATAATTTGTSTGTGTGTGSGTGTAATSSGHAVVGKTTYGDLYDWGLTEAQVEASTGFKPGLRAQSVRDAATAAGIEFSTFRTALQELVDKANK